MWILRKKVTSQLQMRYQWAPLIWITSNRWWAPKLNLPVRVPDIVPPLAQAGKHSESENLSRYCCQQTRSSLARCFYSCKRYNYLLYCSSVRVSSRLCSSIQALVFSLNISSIPDFSCIKQQNIITIWVNACVCLQLWSNLLSKRFPKILVMMTRWHLSLT